MHKGFTLLEILIVVAVLAIITAAVFLILNPAEYLAQSRDTTRISDIDALNRALILYKSLGASNFGNGNVVYTSLPIVSDSACVTEHPSLPTLPSPWTYNCVTEPNLRKNDGNGWIPVPFNSISTGSPLARLPIDPKNDSSDGNYYTYVKGSWLLTAKFESKKFSGLHAKDGGTNENRFEKGSNLLAMQTISEDFGSGTGGEPDPMVRYWVGGTGNWSDVAHWSTTSGGLGGASLPTSSHDVFFDVNSFTGVGQIVIIDTIQNAKNIDWTGVQHEPTLWIEGGSLE